MAVEPSPDLLDLLGTRQAHLVQDQHVGKPDLAEFEVHQRGILGVREDLVRVHHADDAVQPDPVPQVGIVEGHEDPGWIGYATGFKQDVLGPFGPVDRFDDGFEQVVANLAADAAVRQAHHVTIHPDDEFGVDIDRAKVVDEDPHAQAVIPGQDAIQQRRLARPEKAGQDRYRNGFAVVLDDFHIIYSFLSKRRPPLSVPPQPGGGTPGPDHYFLNLLMSIPITFAIST